MSLWCLLAKKALKHRRVKHYGYEFRYDNNNVDKDKPLAAGKTVPVLESFSVTHSNNTTCLKKACRKSLWNS